MNYVMLSRLFMNNKTLAYLTENNQPRIPKYIISRSETNTKIKIKK